MSAMVPTPPTQPLPPTLSGLLSGLRRRIRLHIVSESLAAFVVCLGIAFWVLLALDWTLEPSREIRRGLLAIVAAVWALLAWRFLWQRLRVGLPDRSMAVLLERRHPQFQDGLLTTVELGDHPEELPGLGREMLAYTAVQAERNAGQVQLASLFDQRRLLGLSSAASLLVVTIGLFAWLLPSGFWFGLARLATASDELWPRRTRLVIRGFEGGDAVIAKGSDLEITVDADTAREVPRTVQVRYTTADGGRGSDNMIKTGNARTGEDPWQPFVHTFSSVLTDRSFDVLGGDARLSDLRIRVVDSPAIHQLTLAVEYPAYLERLPAEIPVTGAVQLPQGTALVVRAVANKDLVWAQLDFVREDQTTQSEKTEPVAGGNPREFQFPLAALLTDTTLSFSLHDTDGITNREPVRLALSAAVDEPPVINVRLEGISTAITPQARIPLVGQIRDDYGVASTQVELAVDDQPARQVALGEAPRLRTELPVTAALEAERYELKAGQKLALTMLAADARSLPSGEKPNQARGERFVLDVVTANELRTLLEARELNLRQRFETILEEVEATRNSLVEVATLPTPAAEPAPTGAASPGAEPPTTAADPLETAAREQARRQIIVQRARQNCLKNGDESLGVARSFEEILAELVNNRVDTTELRTRLKEQIADPLRAVVETDFADWTGRLLALSTGEQTGPHRAVAEAAALAKADEILVKMQQIRDRMLELETFNEALDLLRGILADQRKLREATHKRRLERVRNLLE